MAPSKEISHRWMLREDVRMPRVPELLMLGYDRFTEAMPLTRHEHDGAYEFVYVESGKVTWEVDGILYATKSGEAFHTRPNESHRARLDFMEPCAIWWLIMREPSAPAPWLGLRGDELDFVSGQLDQLPRVVRPHARIKSSLAMLRQTLMQAQEPWLTVRARHLMLDILLSFLEPAPYRRLPADLDAAMQRLAEQIRRTPDKRWTNEELAVTIGVSESHFYRLFRDMFGQSPASYIERYRIEYAGRLLSETDLPVTRLALDLEFKTSQHFGTVFKKLTGMTPTQWRQIHRNRSYSD